MKSPGRRVTCDHPDEIIRWELELLLAGGSLTLDAALLGDWAQGEIDLGFLDAVSTAFLLG